MNTPIATLAKNLAAILAREGYTQSDIAKVTGISQPLLSKLLSGDAGKLRPATIGKINAFVGLSSEERESAVAKTRVRDVFLSHSSKDKEFARRLACDIEAAANEGEKLGVWIDEAEIPPGSSIPGLINSGLERSRFVVVVMTANYFSPQASGWTDAEWHAALHADPDNRRARILPLLAGECPYVPMLLRHLLTIDMRGAKYGEGLERLLGILRGEPLPRPITYRGQLLLSNRNIDRTTLVAERAVPEGDPDVGAENLSCNLLPVERMPTHVYFGAIRQQLRTPRKDGTDRIPPKSEIKKLILDAQGTSERRIVPAFRVLGDQIITFHDLEADDSLFAPVVNPTEVTTVPTASLVADEEERRIVVSLVSMSLSRFLVGGCGLCADPERDRRFFFPPEDGKERVVEWKPFRKLVKRRVTRPFELAGRSRWLHQAAYIEPVYIGGKFYIQITPTWLLSVDGFHPMGGPRVSGIIVRWTGGERNLQLVYHVRFWTSVLKRRPGPISIRMGDQTMDVATVPAFVEVPYGIKTDLKDLLVTLDEVAPLIAEQEESVEVEARSVLHVANADEEVDSALDEVTGDEEEAAE